MTNRETEEKLRKLAAVDPGIARAGWQIYLSGEGEDCQLADDLIDVLAFQHLGKDYREQIFLEPPARSVCGGDYALGDVIYPPERAFGSFGLREDEWVKHMLITGMTGTGKTNLAFHILRQLAKSKKPFIVFDWKRNYRDLLQLKELGACKVFTVGSEVAPFRFNPSLSPPGVGPGEWLMKLVDVIKHAYFVGDGVEYLLRDGIDTVYEECGFFKGYPTLTEERTLNLVKTHMQTLTVE